MDTIEINNIVSVFQGKRFSVFNEKVVQAEINELLTGKFEFVREKKLAHDSIIDFFISGEIGIEVKIEGGKKKIYRQCERYCGFAEIKGLILVTARTMNLPKWISGKPCIIINISHAWL